MPASPPPESGEIVIDGELVAPDYSYAITANGLAALVVSQNATIPDLCADHLKAICEWHTYPVRFGPRMAISGSALVPPEIGEI
jgi:hypothetical protein